MSQPNDLSRSLVALDQDSTIIAVVEMSQSSWLVGGILPGIERQPRKKLEPNPERLLALLHRWRDESVRAGRTITRIAVAFDAGSCHLLDSLHPEKSARTRTDITRMPAASRGTDGSNPLRSCGESAANSSGSG